MKLEALCRYLNELFPSDKVPDYCPNGLQVEGKEEVNTIATAVSASLETIEAAVEAQVDALIVHHGLFWERESRVIRGSKKKKLELLLGQGISLIAYHLPMDMHPQLGNNWKAALEMGWTDLQPFMINGLPLGVKGNVRSCSQEEFQKMLENYYEHSATCALGGSSTVCSAALISGGAYKNMTEACRDGVDAFVTGNFDEPAWYQAHEDKINFFALGHAATERVGPRALAQHLTGKLEIPVLFLDIPNPF